MRSSFDPFSFVTICFLSIIIFMGVNQIRTEVRKQSKVYVLHCKETIVVPSSKGLDSLVHREWRDGEYRSKQYAEYRAQEIQGNLELYEVQKVEVKIEEW